MEEVVSHLGSLFWKLNPSLMEVPPSAEEVSGEDICFWGPNGERDVSMATYCRDLPDGKRALLASWYLSPERHAVEFVFFFVFFGGMVLMNYPSLKKREGMAKAPHVLIRAMTAFCFWVNIVYKFAGYPGKFWFMLMPCNVCWSLCYAICFMPKLTEHASHVLTQLLFSCIGLCLLAVVIPDTSDLVMWGEVPFFFLSHYALLAMTPYFAWTGRFSTHPHNNNGGGETWVHCVSRWLFVSTGMTGLFYFNLVTIISLLSGHNLNYMTSPPPTPGDIIDGPDYRIASALLIFALFILTRIIGILIESLYKTIRFTPKVKSI